MASLSHNCCVCDLRHINKPSIVWCTECDEGLCKECHEHHSLSKGTRNHNTIAIREYMNLPCDVIRITQNCVKHQEKFLIYCRNHECPCCGKCVIENHKECRDLENLDDVIKNVKTSNAVHEIEETLVEVAENLQKIRQHQQQNLSTLKEKRKQIEKEIQKTRTTINSHLDKLQEDLLKQLYEVEEKENLKIRQLLSALVKKEKEISDKKRNIANITQHATELQLFLSLKKIDEDISSKDDILNSLLQDEHLKNRFLEYKVNTAIISDIKSFGDVHIEEKPCEILLSSRKTKQAQTMIPAVQSRTIDNINLKINKTIQNKGYQIYGCCMFPDGRMVFAYSANSSIEVFSNKKLNDFEVTLPFNPFDIVYNSYDDTLAVTSGTSMAHCITIIDMKKKQIMKTISVDSDIHGIALKDYRLIYISCDKGIRLINLYDESITDIVRHKMPRNGFIATFGNQIYHTSFVTNTVTCYDHQGKPQWTFQNESVLMSPRGIDADNNGNVYVVGLISKNVVVISPDGQRHREVLGTNDGLDQPVSLCFNDTKKQLLVANCNNVAKLFDFV